MKKLLSALACGVLLMCGGMSVARADYYEMYNPATRVEGGAMVYETTRGTLMSLKVHSGEWQDDHYHYETEASGVVRFAHDGERFIGYLHVPSLASYENGMGYPSQYRYSMPLYEKYALSNPQGYQAQSKLYGAWILGEPEGNNRVLPSLAGTYERSNKRGTRFVQGETEMPWIVAKLFLQLVLEPNVNLLDRNNGSFSFWDYQWEQEKALYPDVDKRYSYHTMTKAGDPDAPNPVQFKDARYLVEKSGRLIYNITDDGVVRKIYDLAEE
ncbi:MAG: hypothetical protein ACLUUD_01210 [Phascolarctobacterium succinatutens]|uniref:hypothetical protein n=1 Tax=Phascolarctobacterium succinatutens TaxID=626940 RepID=UPI0026ECFF40|nr:hypothetical protein [Phascolarctobacterium succinatutens]